MVLRIMHRVQFMCTQHCVQSDSIGQTPAQGPRSASLSQAVLAEIDHPWLSLIRLTFPKWLEATHPEKDQSF